MLTDTYGIYTCILAGVASSTFIDIGSESEVVMIRVNRREGQAAGNPWPVIVIDPPLSEPTKALVVRAVLRVKGRELV